MTSQVVNSWTFSELVAAFLDLTITYCLLCASASAFFASRFLALFGLCLPCPCDGLFGNPRSNNHNCLQRQMVDCSYEKISSVYFSAKSKFPFDSVLGDDDRKGNSRLKYENEGNFDGNGNAEFECGPSSSSFPEGRFQDLAERDRRVKPRVEFGEVNLEGSREEEYRIEGQRPRHGLRRRWKGGFASYGKSSSISSYDTLQSDARNIPQSPPSISKMGNEVTQDPDDGESPTDFELNNSNDDNKHMEREAVSVGELGRGVQGNLGVDKNEENTIRELEQALEEEHAARSALYLELEKERSAAATAADEAMAMILRLQKEKSLIEMEARQYQRMIETKAAYDAEEMNILKEILLRREREKHFLEKEVEAYRQMILVNAQSDSDLQYVADLQVETSTLFSGVDPILLLQETNASIEKPKLKIADGSSRYETQNYTLVLGKELAIPELDEDDDSVKKVDVPENPSVDKHSHFLVGNEFNHEKSVSPFAEEPDQIGGTSLCIDLPAKASNIPYRERRDPPNLVLDAESCVYDVHVIDDTSKMLDAVSVERNAQQSASAQANVPKNRGASSLSTVETWHNMNRSCSDITGGLPPTGYSPKKALVTDFRRNSMSAVDYEKLKIENEVEWLRERLRVVQKGREKLNFSVGHREREKLQLQLLEDIAGQLREIRQLNEPGKAERQASLPPYSKVTSKKRRWRSASLGIHRST